MIILRQLTSAVIHVGPFVATTDATTPSTAIAISAITIPPQIFKNQSTAGTTCDGNTWDELQSGGQSYGWYHFSADSSDTEFCGSWSLTINAASTALPVFVQGRVVPQAVYDGLFPSTTVASSVGIVGSAGMIVTTSTTVKANIAEIIGSTSMASHLSELTSHTTDFLSANDSLLLVSSDSGLVGTDGQALISADAQDLSGSLDVNVNAINGDTCDATNFQAWIDAAISANDSKTLLSTDASWLTGDATAVLASISTVVNADVIKINGDSCDVNNMQAWLNNTIGTDNLTLISADAQDLSGSLSVDVNAISGDTCDANNFVGWLDNGIGADNKALVSSDESWLTGDATAVIVTTSTSIKANVTEVIGDTCTAQDLVDHSSLVANLDAAISSRSSDNAAAIFDTCSVLATSAGAAESLSFEQLLVRGYQLLNNGMDVSDASGQAALRNMGASTDVATATITDDGTTTTRTAWTWSADT